MDRVIGLGDFYISQDITDVLKIYALASCIGLVMFSPKKSILGVAHILLPTASINLEISKISPAYFADTGVTFFANKFFNEYCCSQNDIVVSIYGGAESISKKDIFNIGQRNLEVVKQKLQEYKLGINEQQTGGKVSRTIEADVATGGVKVSTQQML